MDISRAPHPDVKLKRAEKPVVGERPDQRSTASWEHRGSPIANDCIENCDQRVLFGMN